MLGLHCPKTWQCPKDREVEYLSPETFKSLQTQMFLNADVTYQVENSISDLMMVYSQNADQINMYKISF